MSKNTVSVFPLGNHGRPVLLAHRGAPAYGVPENSRAAFDAVMQSGEAAGLETDLQATADGCPVISHDPLWHAVDGDVEISGVTWAELSKRRLANGEAPLAFEEFLERYPRVYLNVDFKSAATLPEGIRILRGRRDLGRLALGSFSAKRVRKLARALGPEPGYLPGASDFARILLAVESGILFSWPSALLSAHGGEKTPAEEDSSNYGKCTIEVGESIGKPRLESLFRLLPRILRDYQCALAVPERTRGIRVVTRRFVAGAHILGCPVYVWTVNDVAQFKRLKCLGVDGIYTDIVHTFNTLDTL